MVRLQVWTDGPAFNEIRRRLAALSDAKDEIESLRKSLKKQLPLPEGPKPDASGPGKQTQGGGSRRELEGTISPKEFVDRDEVLKVQNPQATGTQIRPADPFFVLFSDRAVDERSFVLLPKTRLAALKREEDGLVREKERLEAERLGHIRCAPTRLRCLRWPGLDPPRK
jgi:hypothetical protein